MVLDSVVQVVSKARMRVGRAGGGGVQPRPTRAFRDFQRSENRRKAPRRAQDFRPEVDPLALCIEKRVFLIFGRPKIRKMPRGERKESAWRSIPLLFVLRSLIFLFFGSVKIRKMLQVDEIE